MVGSRKTKLSPSTPPSGTLSERTALQAVLNRAGSLGATEVWQCNGMFADGFLVRQDSQRTPIEIKETLGWPQLTSACFQLVSLNNMEQMQATEGWIIYEKLSTEWTERHGEAAIQHANDCARFFQVGIEIKFMRLLSDGSFEHTGGSAA
jgi:hypothetical protein